MLNLQTASSNPMACEYAVVAPVVLLAVLTLQTVHSEENWHLAETYSLTNHDDWATGFDQCRGMFYLTYSYGFAGKVWQGVKGHVGVHDEKAIFSGAGALYLPLFACNDLLPRYAMRFVVSPDRTRNVMAVMGNSLDPSKSSFLVSVDGNSLRLTIVPRADHWDGSCHGYWESSHPETHHGGLGAHADIVTLALPLQLGHNVVTVVQEKGYIFLQVNTLSTAARGDLPMVTDEPLYIGAGADPRSHQVLPRYKGTFDSFVFEKCPSELLVSGGY